MLIHIDNMEVKQLKPKNVNTVLAHAYCNTGT